MQAHCARRLRDVVERIQDEQKLGVKVRRGPTHLAIEAPVPARLRPGKTPLRLKVKLRAKSVSGPTAVSTTIVQKRRR